MTKDQCLREAERLGLSIPKNISWNELHSLVSNALKNEPPGRSNQDEIARLKQELAAERAKTKAYRSKYENYNEGRQPTGEEMRNMEIEIAPEILALPNEKLSLYTYEEELNPDYSVEETSFMPGQNNLRPGQYKTDTFNIRRKEGKVIARSTGPRMNARISWPSNERWICVKYRNQEGYLWAQVKKEFRKPGNGRYLNEYEKEISENLISICNRLCIRKEAAENLADRIEREEQKRAMKGY